MSRKRSSLSLQYLILAAIGAGALFIYIANSSSSVQSPQSQPVLFSQQVSASTSTNRKCSKSQVRRRFVGVDLSSPPPPLLYSFPGSGNTWVRLLLDWGTGVYSGSVYSDESLLTILPGERKCDWSVSVIKAHPHLQTFDHFDSLLLPTKCLPLYASTPTARRVEKMVFLLRNPYDAIWSEYQRRKSRGKHNRHLLKYDNALFNDWLASSKVLAQKWVEQFQQVARFQANGTKIYSLKFEHLLPGAGVGGEEELKRVIDFIGVGSSSPQAITCAFVLADNPVAHRGARQQTRLSTRRSFLARSHSHLNKTDVYTLQAVCDVWRIVRDSARANGYFPYGNFSCD